MSLFSKYRLGDLELSNRIVMAPMTRSRAIEGNVPNPLSETYYKQRSSAGLIISEGSQVRPQGMGYIRTPGIYSAAQVAGWKKVTEAVHQEGGKIFLQLWHVGRVSHPDLQPNGELPISASALAADGEVFTMQGKKRMVTPRALETQEIPGIIEQFKKGAENAKAAGFDGVELHGANSYLLDQFLRDGSNHRTDAYGGSLQNRARFGLEVAEAVIGVWGASRVGYRISPYNMMNSMSDSNPVETFSYLTQELNALKLGYLHVLEGTKAPGGVTPLTPILRKKFSGTYIVNAGYDAASGAEMIRSGGADLVAYGVPFIANPDLPARFKVGAPLATPDFSTFYSGDEKGYVDYAQL